VGRDLARVTIVDDDLPAQTPRSTQVIAGADRIGTAIAISQDRYQGGMPLADSDLRDQALTVVLARADQPADALAGTALAAVLHAPILLTGRDGLEPRVLDEIRRVLGNPNPQKVHILGGPAGLSPEVDQQLQRAGYWAVRHEGADRYATAVAIADQLVATEVLLVTGRDFPDGLAAGAAAARRAAVVLLTDGSIMPPATAAYLAAHPDLPVIAIGAPAGRVAPTARLIAGADRYATAVAVAAALFPSSVPVAGLASGEVFPDALAGGAHAAGRGGPLLLTRRSEVPPSVTTYLQAHVTNRLVVYGGPGAVAPTSVAAVTDT
jgi:putative cell wall-binding protein